MPRILHVTDTHLVVPPNRVSGVLDTAALLQNAVTTISETLPRIGPIDALLVTGDLSDDGSVESYELFRRLIAPLDLPLLAIPGNHDRREAMRMAFRDLDLFADAGRLNWVRDVAGVRLIGVDTLVEGSGGGAVDDATLAFLGESLATSGPVLLAVHGPRQGFAPNPHTWTASVV